jgi:hypothetical protein
LKLHTEPMQVRGYTISEHMLGLQHGRRWVWSVPQLPARMTSASAREGAPAEALYPVSVTMGPRVLFEPRGVGGEDGGENGCEDDAHECRCEGFQGVDMVPLDAVPGVGLAMPPAVRENGVIGSAVAAAVTGSVFSLSAADVFACVLLSLTRVSVSEALARPVNHMVAQRDLGRYKTVMCRQFPTTSGCSYGSTCLFAHGTEELRQRPQGSAFHDKDLLFDTKWLVHGLLKLQEAVGAPTKADVLSSPLRACGVLFAGRPLFGTGKFRSFLGDPGAEEDFYFDEDDPENPENPEKDNTEDPGASQGVWEEKGVWEQRDGDGDGDYDHDHGSGDGHEHELGPEYAGVDAGGDPGGVVEDKESEIGGLDLSRSSAEEWRDMTETLTRIVLEKQTRVADEERDQYSVWAAATLDTLQRLGKQRAGVCDVKFVRGMLNVSVNDLGHTCINGWLVDLMYCVQDGSPFFPGKVLPLDWVPALTYQVPFVYKTVPMVFQMGCEQYEMSEGRHTLSPHFYCAVGAPHNTVTMFAM